MIRIVVHTPWVDWFLILAQLVSQVLEEVIIDVWYHIDDEQGSWDRDEINLVFTLLQFSQLCRIWIGLPYPKSLPKSARWMWTLLLVCNRSGILEIGVCVVIVFLLGS